jgi:DNA repair protein RecO (recombination protein O)
LALAVLERTRTGHIWLPVTYFGLWITRLMGWMPDIAHCNQCGRAFGGEMAYFQLQADGLLCTEHKHPASRALSAASLVTATRIFHAPIAALASEEWPANRAADLRRFAMQALERNLERRLHAVAALAKLSQ